MESAITVIDQELIDYFDELESTGEARDVVNVNIGKLSELTTMAKDLIEINSELTKELQKHKAS